MNVQEIQQRLVRAAGGHDADHADASTSPIDATSADGLIGVFQAFRPDGARLHGMFDDLEHGPEFHRRLQAVYDATGDGYRPDGTRDAYFIVRNPPPIESDRARALAGEFLGNLQQLAAELGQTSLQDRLQPLPSIRVLEGLPPKHPRAREERSQLLLAMDELGPQLLDLIDADQSLPQLFRPACYFIACDPFLRDYLIWPFLAAHSALADPYRPYFELWRHRIKYRIFGERQIDLYVPRH